MRLSLRLKNFFTGGTTQNQSVVSALVVCFVSSMIQSCSTNYLFVGERELQRGNYIEAHRIFEKALSQGVDTVQCYAGIGTSQFFTSNRNALTNLRKSDTLSSNATKSTFIHAIVAQDSGYFNEAAQAYSRCISLPELQPYQKQITEMQTGLMKEVQRLQTMHEMYERSAEAKLPINTIAVLPITYPSDDSLLSLVGIGFADFLTTDFSKVKSLTVVERTRLQEIITELNRESMDYDVSTLPKKGRLLGASKLIDCSLGRKTNAIAIDARVVKTEDGKIQTTDLQSGQEEKLFTLEKRLVLNLVQRMKVNITAEERRDILIPQTENLQAFFAYCRGLQAADQFDYQAASKYFEEAMKLDATFQSARVKYNEMKEKLSTPTSLKYLVRILFPILDARFDDVLIRTAGILLESGFINSGDARRDGPTVLPFPPVP